MPYIPLERRALGLHKPGDLAYRLYKECLEYIDVAGLQFATLAEVIGVLESVKHELQRRVVDPYETKKLAENGDVTPD